jgi:7-cyano-7-deazaguanine synthase in queuosine biosynthesis
MSQPIPQRVLDAQKNYAANIAALEAILLRERGYLFEIPHGEDVIALLSGGLDSTLMVDLVIDEWRCRVHPLFVRRGARAEPYEERAFDYYCDLFRQMHGERLAEPIKLSYEVPPKVLKQHIPPERLQAVGHPLRNAVLQSLAVQTAVALNARDGLQIRTVFSGSVPEDTTSPEQGLLSLRVQMLSTCIQLGEWLWQITSPMTEPAARPRPLDDRDLIQRAVCRGIPLDQTRSCFGAAPRADGTCSACRKRRHAFAAAGVRDPVEYETDDDAPGR